MMTEGDATMVLVVGTIRLPVAKLAEARAAMAAMIVASRAEDGCLDYSYAEDVLDPGLIRVTEAWQDRAALDRHFRSDHIAAWRATWPGLGIADRRLTLYAVEATQPI